MRRFIGGFTVLVVIAALLSETASAQLAGNPVYAVTPQAGITLSGDYGRGFPADESPNTDFFGGRLVVGLPVLSFWVGGGVYDSRIGDPKQEIALGGGLAVNLLKAPSLPVALSLQVGGGVLQCGDGCTTINAVAGPALKINVVGAVNVVQPWRCPECR